MTAKEALEVFKYRNTEIDGWCNATGEAADIMDEHLQEVIRTESDILRCIYDLPRAEHRAVLIARYVCRCRWDDIAKRMHYYVRHIYTLHAEAMEELERRFAEVQAEKEKPKMPKKPKKPCAFPGCPELTDDTYCPAHKVQTNTDYNRYARDPSDAQKYDRRWRKIRADYISKHPFCEECLKEKHLTKTQMVHHIRPLAEGGDNSEDNLEALCWFCHNRLHPERGKGRPVEY